MSSVPRRARFASKGVFVRVFVSVFVGALAAGAAGCAHAVVVEKRDDGTVRLRCATALPACLDAGARTACQGTHYVVLRAVDELNVRGSVTTSLEDRSSGAIIQCGPEHTWGALGKPLEDLDKVVAPSPAAAAAASSSAAGAPAASSACMPGTTRVCVGPAACQGGQACLPSGAAFGPCDCGNAAARP
jgi:hypothetical protein